MVQRVWSSERGPNTRFARCFSRQESAQRHAHTKWPGSPESLFGTDTAKPHAQEWLLPLPTLPTTNILHGPLLTLPPQSAPCKHVVASPMVSCLALEKRCFHRNPLPVPRLAGAGERTGDGLGMDRGGELQGDEVPLVWPFKPIDIASPLNESWIDLGTRIPRTAVPCKCLCWFFQHSTPQGRRACSRVCSSGVVVGCS